MDRVINILLYIISIPLIASHGLRMVTRKEYKRITGREWIREIKRVALVGVEIAGVFCEFEKPITLIKSKNRKGEWEEDTLHIGIDNEEIRIPINEGD